MPRAADLNAPATVSVIIPCHNAAHFIRTTVDSMIQQTRPPETIIVIDDASTDGSSAILDELARSGSIRLVRNSNCLGRAVSVNRALDEITSTYVALIDADDVAVTNRLERQVGFMEAHPRVGCSSSFIHYINRSGKKLANGVLDLLTEEDLRRYLSGGEPFGLFCPGVIIRAEVLRNPALRFRGQFWPADDNDLWNRIAEAGWQVLAQPEFLTLYRVHSTSAVTSGARRTRSQFEWVRACLRARRQGRPEPTLEEFQAQLARLPWPAKLNRWRKLEAKAACRSAGFAYGEQNYLAAVTQIFKASCLQPGFVGRRLMQHLFKP